MGNNEQRLTPRITRDQLLEAVESFLFNGGGLMLPRIREARLGLGNPSVNGLKIVDEVSQRNGGIDRDNIGMAVVRTLRVSVFCASIVADGRDKAENEGVKHEVFRYVWDKWNPRTDLEPEEIVNRLVDATTTLVDGRGIEMGVGAVNEKKSRKPVSNLEEIFGKIELSREEGLLAKRLEMLLESEKRVLTAMENKWGMARKDALEAVLKELHGVDSHQVNYCLEKISEIMDGSRVRFVGTDGIPMVTRKQPIEILNLLSQMSETGWNKLSIKERMVMEYIRERDDRGRWHTFEDILGRFGGEGVNRRFLSRLSTKIKKNINSERIKNGK